MLFLWLEKNMFIIMVEYGFADLFEEDHQG